MNKLEKALAEAGWEIIPRLYHGEDKSTVIRPLRKVEKRPTYTIDMSEFGGGESIFSNDYFFTEAQAELVGDAVEALMENIMGDGNTPQRNVYKLIDAAREALEGTND